jgi:hypothetical protein
MAAKGLSALLLGLALANPAAAGKADVLHVDIAPRAGGPGFDIAVTLRHDDSGWDHYANRWEVVGPDGRILATRTLFHPHVEEQPFTRRLDGVAIAPTTTWVRIRAHDLVHGYGGREVTLSVPHPRPTMQKP